MKNMIRITILAAAVLAASLGMTTAAQSQNVDGYDVTAGTGDMGTVHDNGPTTYQSQYNFDLGKRFTGDFPLGSTNTTEQHQLQKMLDTKTTTMLLAPNSVSGASFQGSSNLGFTGSPASMIYHGPYATELWGNLMPATGTGDVSLNIINNGYGGNSAQFLVPPSYSYNNSANGAPTTAYNPYASPPDYTAANIPGEIGGDEDPFFPIINLAQDIDNGASAATIASEEAFVTYIGQGPDGDSPGQGVGSGIFPAADSANVLQ